MTLHTHDAFYCIEYAILCCMHLYLQNIYENSLMMIEKDFLKILWEFLQFFIEDFETGMKEKA